MDARDRFDQVIAARLELPAQVRVRELFRKESLAVVIVELDHRSRAGCRMIGALEHVPVRPALGARGHSFHVGWQRTRDAIVKAGPGSAA
jgi:hypothetical protein